MIFIVVISLLLVRLKLNKHVLSIIYAVVKRLLGILFYIRKCLTQCVKSVSSSSLSVTKYNQLLKLTLS